MTLVRCGPQIDAVVSKLPAPVRSLLRDRFHLLQAAVDAAATILFLALGKFAPDSPQDSVSPC